MRHIISSSTPLPVVNAPRDTFVFDGLNVFCTVITLLVEALYGMEFVVEQATNKNTVLMTAVLSNILGRRMAILLIAHRIGLDIVNR
jgi:hypothetical protein